MGAISEVGQIGRTRLFTRFEVRLRYVAAVLALLGAAAAAAVGTAVVAHRDRAGAGVAGRHRPAAHRRGRRDCSTPTGTSTAHLQFPVTVTFPPLDPWWPAC